MCVQYIGGGGGGGVPSTPEGYHDSYGGYHEDIGGGADVQYIGGIP